MRGDITWHVKCALKGRAVQTAAEIHSLVQFSFNYMPTKRTVTLATVSSTLRKLVKSGFAIRVPNFGPRSGNGYLLAREHWGWR